MWRDFVADKSAHKTSRLVHLYKLEAEFKSKKLFVTHPSKQATVKRPKKARKSQKRAAEFIDKMKKRLARIVKLHTEVTLLIKGF